MSSENQEVKSEAQPVSQPEPSQGIVTNFDTFCKMYQALGNMIQSFPINQKYKEYIIKDFDNGYLWMKEAVSAALFALQNAPKQEEAVSTEAPASEESAAA